MNTLIQIRRLWKPLVFALLLAWALLFPAPPGLALAAAEPIAPPQPQLYIAPLPEEIQAKLPEIIIPDQALRLRSGYAESCMWQADLPAGSLCYIIQPWAAGGLYHMVLAGERTWYVSTGELDLSQDYGYVFNAQQDMHTKSGYSAEELESLLQGGLSGFGADFAAAEAAYGVNALLLIAICRLESGWADSYLAVNYHNLAGLGGSGGWLRFDSHSACIDYLGQVLSERYLNPDSAFYKGCTIPAICRTYCGGSSHWTNSVTRYMDTFNEALLAARNPELVAASAGGA